MPIELKPCPFCGGKADLVQPGTHRHSCIVECLNCGCRLERLESGDEGEHSGAAWNCRFTGPGHLDETGYIPAGSAAERDAEGAQASNGGPQK